ncbi:elongator complex protein 3 [Geotalea toluenoxydans]|uniref:elongator complex protein 3 n=1 Tax=Geotalea toluenoxydans TaxID=421624 RepID=UPI0006D00C72|nr:radical SAM protein [Geotalea toluenoxydans]
MTVTVPFFISHLGCPHQCVFCNQMEIAGTKGQMPGQTEILAKVAAYRLSGGCRPVQVAYFGGTFTALPRAVQEGLLQPLQPLLVSGEVESIRISTRPDCVDVETAQFLRGMGVRVVELGIQSMADEVLEMSGRGHAAAHVERAASVLRQAGLLWGAQLMPGLPGDSPAKAMASLERVIALEPSCLRIYPTLVIKDTPLASLFEQGLYEPLTMETGICLCMAMLHRALQARLPVIRMGLQPTVELDAAGTVLAGPYHPAFRYLVESELCFQLLSGLVKGFGIGTPVRIACASGWISNVIGHKRSNVERLEQKHGIKVLSIQGESALSVFEVIVEADGKKLRGHLLDDLDPGQFLTFIRS